MPVNPNEAPKLPECAVRGLTAPRAMFAFILVGGELCGFAGGCCHQVVKAKPATANFPHDDMGTPV